MTCQQLNGPPLSADQIAAYLARLELKKPESLTLDYLSRLQWAHMTHIPFDNLPIMAGELLSLERQDLYRKLIEQGRGGVCAELNGMLNWLLESLGYAVESYNCRIIAKSLPLQPQTHRVLSVTLDGNRYLVDAGWSMEHHRIPLLMENGLVQSDGTCEYRLDREETLGWILWQNRPGCGWRKILSFNEYPQLDVDYITGCHFSTTHENSRVNKYTRVTIFTDDLFYGIREHQFLQERRGVVEPIEPITSRAQERRILEETFHFPPAELEQYYGNEG